MADVFEERKGAVKFKGNAVTLVGPELKVGDMAPDFDLFTTDMQSFSLSDALANGTRAALIIVVPSIDTSVCSLETVKFNRQTADLAKDKMATFTISVDLPFAQKRWCSTEKVESVQLLSDYRDHRFGPTWGVLIKELGLLARAIFLVDKGGVLRYVEVVPEIALEPNYDDVLRAARGLIE
jgi:thiol peroxidase